MAASRPSHHCLPPRPAMGALHHYTIPLFHHCTTPWALLHHYTIAFLSHCDTANVYYSCSFLILLMPLILLLQHYSLATAKQPRATATVTTSTTAAAASIHCSDLNATKQQTVGSVSPTAAAASSSCSSLLQPASCRIPGQEGVPAGWLSRPAGA